MWYGSRDSDDRIIGCLTAAGGRGKVEIAKKKSGGRKAEFKSSKGVEEESGIYYILSWHKFIENSDGSCHGDENDGY